MVIRATKKFANELNKRIKGSYCIESVELIKVPRNQAYTLIGGGYDDRDIDWENNMVKCIYVTYKPDCYALGRYVTTGDLNRLCRYISDLTLENYVSEFLNAYEI